MTLRLFHVSTFYLTVAVCEVDGATNVPNSSPLHELPAERRRNAVNSSLAAAVFSGVTIFAAVLLSRRLAGAFSPPRAAWPAIIAAFVCLLLTGSAYLSGWIARRGKRRPVTQVTAGLFTLVPPIVVGGSLIPSGSLLGLWFLIALFAVCAAVVAMLETEHAGPPFSREANPAPAWAIADRSRGQQIPDIADSSKIDIAAVADAANKAALSHWMSRRIGDDAAFDVIEGVVTVQFTAGQKLASVHLPFCPPFSEVPGVECEPRHGADVRLRQASLQPFGARIDVQRSQPLDSAASVEIAYTATARLPKDKAA